MTAADSQAKFFTVEQANAALPLVRAIAQDISQLSRSILERRERIALLRGDRQPKADDLYDDEMASAEQEVDKDITQLREYVAELAALGVELKSAPEGLIDFPAMQDGRPVYLCWKLGEPEVLFWHELDTGFGGRQSLTADSITGPST